MIFGTAGAAGGGGAATIGSTTAVPGAGRLSRRLSAIINPAANTTATIAVMTIAIHRRCGDGTLIFTPLLVFKELAELDERVEQGLRDLILV